MAGAAVDLRRVPSSSLARHGVAKEALQHEGAESGMVKVQDDDQRRIVRQQAAEALHQDVERHQQQHARDHLRQQQRPTDQPRQRQVRPAAEGVAAEHRDGDGQDGRSGGDDQAVAGNRSGTRCPSDGKKKPAGIILSRPVHIVEPLIFLELYCRFGNRFSLFNHFLHAFSLSPATTGVLRCRSARAGAITSDTMDISLMRMFMDGPECLERIAHGVAGYGCFMRLRIFYRRSAVDLSAFFRSFSLHCPMRRRHCSETCPSARRSR